MSNQTEHGGTEGRDRYNLISIGLIIRETRAKGNELVTK